MKIKIPLEHRRLVFVVFMFLLSCNIFPQVTIDIKNKSIKEAVKEIENKSVFKFFFNDDLKELDKVVSISFSDKDIDTVLKQLLTDSEIGYQKQEKNIILLIPQKANQKQEKQKKITGVVKDEGGEHIIGATIMVKGATTGTVTDIDGKFSLEVPKGSSLIISYIGYLSQEIKFKGDKFDYQIVLKENLKVLDEVVVVGYGVQRKRDVTTSISSVRASDIQDMAVSSIEQALVGRMAGVQITQPNGTPGAGFDIKVRGVGTITAGSSPLYVIDGVPLSDDTGKATGISVSPLASIEMSDIESIEILKDASAAAIYGSRGSNGVVIITTKKGKDGKPIVQYNGHVGMQSVTKKIDVLNAYEYSQLVFDGHNAAYYDQLKNAGKTNLYDPWATNQQRWDNLKTGTLSENQGWMLPPEILPYVRGEKGLTDTDWQDAVLRTGFMQKHSLSVSGGNKNLRYLISGNYQDEEGVVINSSFTKMGFRTKVDMTHNKFKIGGNINLTRNVFDLVNTEGRYANDGVLSAALGAAPIYPVRNPDREFNYQHNNTSYGQSKINNPVAIASLIDDKMTALQMLATGYVEYKIMKSLNFKTQGSWNYNNYVRDSYRPAALPNSTDRMPPSNPTAESRTKNKYTWVWENTLNYKNKFGRHAITGLGGWTAQKYLGNANRLTATDLPQNDILHTIPITAKATKYDSSKDEWSLLSALARAQYNYTDKYLFSVAIRADGSSRFGKNNKWGYFPSASAAWYMTEENFMKSVPWISNLKLRTSWGVTGNMSIGNYASFGIVEGDNYPFGGGSSIGMKESTSGNPNIGWEKTSQVNIGAEIGLFKWLNLEVDVYQGTTTDMLLKVPVMEISGFSTVLQNIGKLTNKGIELTLSSNHKIGNVLWTNSFNYAANRNKVKSLGSANEIVTQSNSVIDFITKVGEPIGNYYTYVVDGVYQNQAEINADMANGIIVPNAQPGDFRFKKFGSDNIINADDKTITGNYLPDFTYGYSTHVKYRMFDFSLALQGVYGNEIANINRRYLANMEGNANQLGIARDRWVSESQQGSGKVYRANRNATGMNTVISSWHIEDGSYMRIREITFGFTFLKQTVSRLGISTLRIYGSAFNPFTFTNYSGYNPEVSTDSSPIMQGVDYGTYPLAKSFVFGINFTL